MIISYFLTPLMFAHFIMSENLPEACGEYISPGFLVMLHRSQKENKMSSSDLVNSIFN